MRFLALLVAVLTGVDSPSNFALPGLHGVDVITGSDRGSSDVIQRIGASDPDCVGDLAGGIALAADVAPEPGDETVLASFSQGVVVLAADGHRIASTGGFDCSGSRDDLIAVEIARTSFEGPIIAVLASEGGRRQSSTWLALYAVGASHMLDRLFIGEIERRDDDGIHVGEVTLFPSGLVYHHPTDGVSVWRFDHASHQYVLDHASGSV